MHIVLLIICLFICFPAHAQAKPEQSRLENTAGEPQVPPVSGDFNALKHTSSTRVGKVIDGQTIMMKDGNIVRLLGLEYPLMSGGDAGTPMVNAKEFLEKLLPQNTELMIYQTRKADRGRTNRMGHTLAHLVKKQDKEWVNGKVIREGLAWALTDKSNSEMTGQLYALEQLARADKKGLWANPVHGMLTPENAHEGDGTFRVVEGTVNRAATSRNNLYLNFGSDWRKDFTVQITPALRKDLSRAGVDAMNLPGQTVRVRGWIREWNGPFMELEIAERLEITPSQVEAVPQTVGDAQEPQPSPIPFRE